MSQLSQWRRKRFIGFWRGRKLQCRKRKLDCCWGKILKGVDIDEKEGSAMVKNPRDDGYVTCTKENVATTTVLSHV